MDALPDDLDTLVETALALDGPARRRTATRINGWLQLRRQVANEHERDQVLHWLDEPRFIQLEDERGIACRAEAVELLLSLGYPGALHVSPEALESVHGEPVSKVNRTERSASFAALAGFVPLLGMLLFDDHSSGCLLDPFYQVTPPAVMLGLLRAAFGVRGQSQGAARWVLHAIALGALVPTGLALFIAYAERAPVGFTFALIGAVALAATLVPRANERLR